jgi:hypothetical protein
MTTHVPHLDRRGFSLGLAAAFSGLGVAACATRSPTGTRAAGYGALAADPAGFLDLPADFSYRVISSFGDPMSDGHYVPDRADGMGCFALAEGRHALVRNHELSPKHVEAGAYRGAAIKGAAFDRLADGRALPGGTTTIVIDDQRPRDLAAPQPGGHHPQLCGRHDAMGQLADLRRGRDPRRRWRRAGPWLGVRSAGGRAGTGRTAPDPRDGPLQP